MTTPIVDFVKKYIETGTIRAHMPGHKGTPMLGFEPLDLTEIGGADDLFDADGIIRESEMNAGRLFGARTFYSTEGSSLCVRAMLYLAALYSRELGRKPVIAAGRNAHKSFLTGAALLEIYIIWIYPHEQESYLSCTPTAEEVERLFHGSDAPTAVFLTSPDYLGSRVAELREIAEVCHKHGALLLVDNAHGAYLKFLPESQHPMDLGADMCCDSAHKTLPVITGGAYLHISHNAPVCLKENARYALGMFGSSSPSYLILQSLDLANRYLESYPERLAEFIEKVDGLKRRLMKHGYSLSGDEPLKVTICAKKYGYTVSELHDKIRRQNIEAEFADPDFLVLMLTPENGGETIGILERAFLNIPKKPEITVKPPFFTPPTRKLSIREACFAPWETVGTDCAVGRTLAGINIACPPAVPVVVSGEVIDDAAAECLRYYGVEKVRCAK